MPRANYDKQGLYWHHLIRVSGWDQSRVDRLLLVRFSATHWNALSGKQRREAINVMKGYAKKAETKKAAKLRQGIVALCKRHGMDIEWLHDMMNAWGFGTSLRALSYAQTVEVHRQLKAAFGAEAS